MIKTKAVSYRNWLQGQINNVLKNSDLSLMERTLLDNVLQSCLYHYDYFHNPTKATVEIEGWKGKDEIQYIEKPDSFDIITHQKKDQDSEPKEIRRNISKREINDVIRAINSSRMHENTETKEMYCTTPEIAHIYCIIAKITHNKKGNSFFPDGKFEWQHFFADRRMHTNLNLILRLLDHFGVIKYRAGRINVLNKGFSFQLNLL